MALCTILVTWARVLPELCRAAAALDGWFEMCCPISHGIAVARRCSKTCWDVTGGLESCRSSLLDLVKFEAHQQACHLRARRMRGMAHLNPFLFSIVRFTGLITHTVYAFCAQLPKTGQFQLLHDFRHDSHAAVEVIYVWGPKVLDTW